MDKFKVRIVTPERVFYEGEADMVEMNTTEGQIGCYPGHIPLTVIVKPGVLSIHDNGEIKTAALHAGFAEILPDSFNILAETVEWKDEIDEERARAAMERAKKRLESKTDVDDLERSRYETALQRAITRIDALK
ncbi:MAG: ATP synthase F1 subunit epsilon [Lachnospiraceae bacterium]|nr:ATP synthase F1 subunit epsilon [Lachnospiraceae bacterium]